MSWFCYDLKKQQLRKISKEDREIFYRVLREGMEDEENWEEEGECLQCWPNKMEYDVLDE